MEEQINRFPHGFMGPAEGLGGDSTQVWGIDHPIPHRLRQIHQGMRGRGWLWGQHVKARTAKPSIQKGLTDGGVVHQVATGGVDENASRPHSLQKAPIDQPSGLWGDRTVER